MRVFDIPLHPPGDTWRVSQLDGWHHSFDGRPGAVSFAEKLAARLESTDGGAYLSIEGEDGKWRLFTPALKAPV
ncbi:MAG: hypothetical protein AAGC76_05215 [Luteibacter sp.]|uniref:hypothetical protein n=1 Tax=Luteibacter sp. TaxID=1886636 RepID=UPI0028066677|nr:hypothetical protein [Luteibacter sp.]MDQ7995237.1 hypothetical protein [Luteibacter sp.]